MANVELGCVVEGEVAFSEALPVLVMVSVTAQNLAAVQPGCGAQGAGGEPQGRAWEGAASAASGGVCLGEVDAAASAPQFLDVCSLEGCGLGWRVRTLARRRPWTVVAQRMRLCMEAPGGARIERVYTLLENHEIAPHVSHEVCIGDLHAGDTCLVPVLLWLPALDAPTLLAEAVRFLAPLRTWTRSRSTRKHAKSVPALPAYRCAAASC